MRSCFRYSLFLSMFSVPGLPSPALTEGLPLISGSYETLLDMDRDGRRDRAVATVAEGSRLVDLYIYLAPAQADPSHRPSLLKSGLTGDLLLELEGRDDGTLIVGYGCGGCSNDHATTLLVAYRDGEFLVTGASYSWDTREGAGYCEIDLQAGRGFVSEGPEGEQEQLPLEGMLAPVKLMDWSDELRPDACGG